MHRKHRAGVLPRCILAVDSGAINCQVSDVPLDAGIRIARERIELDAVVLEGEVCRVFLQRFRDVLAEIENRLKRHSQPVTLETLRVVRSVQARLLVG
ncbi:hypothetical protein D3C85_1666510 [compost metagenome]